MKLPRPTLRLIACCLLALPVLFLVEEHLRGRWLLARWKSTMAARGEKFTLDECRPPTVAGPNGFHDFTAASALAPRASLSKKSPPLLRQIAPGKAVAWQTLTEWRMDDDAPRNRTNITWLELQQELYAWTNYFADAAAALRQPVVDARLEYWRGFSLPLPHLAQLKKLSQNLSTQTADDLHHGRLDAAIENIEIIHAAARALQTERLVISELVRQSIVTIAFNTTWQALQRPGWNDVQLARLQAAWTPPRFTEGLVLTLTMERAMTIETFASARQSTKAAADILNMSSGGFGMAPGPVRSITDIFDYLFNHGDVVLMRGIILPLWQFAWSRHDELNFLDTTQPLIDAARACATNRIGQPALDAEKSLHARLEEQAEHKKLRFLLSSEISRWLERSVAKSVSTDVQREIVIAAIALQRHALRHGRPAPTLETLVPEFLAEPPRDHWAGGPLRYRTSTNGTFSLYSIGRNLRDDGGDATPLEGTAVNQSSPEGRDLVWPQPATRAEAITDTEARRGKPGR